jgi:hypothetical protein
LKTNTRAQLQQRLKNPHPVSKQNFFDLLVAKSVFDQFSGDIARVAMVQKVGNEMDMREFLMERSALFVRPAPVKEFEEIEANPDAIDPDQIDHMLNVIDVMIESGFLLL